MSETPQWKVERSYPTVVSVRISGVTAGWKQEFLLRSDAHHDNLHCDQVLEKRHLAQAMERGAGILDFGDLACAMGGKWDKRADPSQMRPELRGSKYLDDLVAYNAGFYEPYAANWLLMSPGNHETSILQRHETNLTERIAERLRMKGSDVQVGTYAGWVRFMFRIQGTKKQTIRLRYTHGYGGGGPVTRDLIQVSRQLVYLGNADILVSGHSHDQWSVPVRREILLDSGRPILQDVEAIKCGGYKDEYSCGQGWAVGKGLPPKPLGAYWLKFEFDSRKGMERITFTTQRAS